MYIFQNKHLFEIFKFHIISILIFPIASKNDIVEARSPVIVRITLHIYTITPYLPPNLLYINEGNVITRKTHMVPPSTETIFIIWAK